MKNTKSTLCRREMLRHILWIGSVSLLPGICADVQKTPLDTHLQDLKNSMVSNNPGISEDMLREYLSPQKILTRHISGTDYKFSFLNSRGQRITLSSDQGCKRSVFG